MTQIWHMFLWIRHHYRLCREHHYKTTITKNRYYNIQCMELIVHQVIRDGKTPALFMPVYLNCSQLSTKTKIIHFSLKQHRCQAKWQYYQITAQHSNGHVTLFAKTHTFQSGSTTVVLPIPSIPRGTHDMTRWLMKKMQKVCVFGSTCMDFYK